MRQFIFLMVLVGLSACRTASVTTPTQAPLPQALKPTNSELAASEPRLIYVTYGSQLAQTDVLNQEAWQNLSPRVRAKYLYRFYFSTTPNRGDMKLRHDSCYVGSAQQVAEKFFAGEKNSIRPKGANDAGGPADDLVETYTSEDGGMLGVSFRMNDDKMTARAYSFRLANCKIAQIPEVDFGHTQSAHVDHDKNIFFRDSRRKPAAIEDGFSILDHIDLRGGEKLFSLKLDPPPVTDPHLPWMEEANKNLDLHQADQNLKLALLIQKYVFEGLVNQDPNPNFNFNADRAEKQFGKYWCQMPWLNVGDAGREALHGLTKERDSRWALDFHNAIACQTISKVWGTMMQPLNPPQFERRDFADGSVNVKFVFAQNGDKGALTIHGNVSGVGQHGERSRKSLQLARVDVMIKDSHIKGSTPGQWLKVSYQFDPHFDYNRDFKARVGIDQPVAEIKNLPPALLKMRPGEIQAESDTSLFTPMAMSQRNYETQPRR